jgi:hypothetical protein
VLFLGLALTARAAAAAPTHVVWLDGREVVVQSLDDGSQTRFPATFGDFLPCRVAAAADRIAVNFCDDSTTLYTPTGEQVRRAGTAAEVYQLAISGDGQTVATLSNQSGNYAATISPPEHPEGTIVGLRGVPVGLHFLDSRTATVTSIDEGATRITLIGALGRVNVTTVGARPEDGIGFLSLGTPEPTLTPTPTPVPTATGPRYSVTICASEFAPDQPFHAECNFGIFAVYDTLRLDPPAGFKRLAPENLQAVIEEVPAGGYVLRASGCSPWVCWGDTAVRVVDRDVFVTVARRVPTPITPPPTRPTSTRPPPSSRTPSPTPSVTASLTPTTTPTPCPGDLNHDGIVTIDEIMVVVNAALTTCQEVRQ